MLEQTYINEDGIRPYDPVTGFIDNSEEQYWKVFEDDRDWPDHETTLSESLKKIAEHWMQYKPEEIYSDHNADFFKLYHPIRFWLYENHFNMEDLIWCHKLLLDDYRSKMDDRVWSEYSEEDNIKFHHKYRFVNYETIKMSRVASSLALEEARKEHGEDFEGYVMVNMDPTRPPMLW